INCFSNKVFIILCHSILHYNHFFSRIWRAGRTGIVQPPEIDDSHARQWSTAQESLIPTRGSSPPLRNRGFPRAGVVHRSEIAESRAQERSTAKKLQNPTHESGPQLTNREKSR